MYPGCSQLKLQVHSTLSYVFLVSRHSIMVIQLISLSPKEKVETRDTNVLASIEWPFYIFFYSSRISVFKNKSLILIIVYYNLRPGSWIFQETWFGSSWIVRQDIHIFDHPLFFSLPCSIDENSGRSIRQESATKRLDRMQSIILHVSSFD